MRARSPAQARFLGLWSAGWLALLLVLGMVRFGVPTLQWPVLLVPTLWALVALRPRRAGAERRRSRGRAAGVDQGWADQAWAEQEPDGWADDGWARQDAGDRDPWPEGGWTAEPPADDQRQWPPPGERTDTVERPALRRRGGGGERG